MISSFFVLGCIAGFMFQSYHVCTVYFRYQTSSKIDRFLSDAHVFPTALICVRYLDVIKVNFSFEEEKFNDYLASFNMKQILEYTPKTGDILASCDMPSDIRFLKVYPRDVCNKKFFTIRKAIFNEHICYTIQPDDKLIYFSSDIVSSLRNSFEIYLIALSETLMSQCRVFTIVAYNLDDELDNDWPLNSRKHGARILRRDEHIRMAISKFSFEINLLPAPYDTKCIKINVEACYESCVSKQLVKINRVSWSNFISEPNDLVMVSMQDHYNATTWRFVNDTINHCRFTCRSRSPCNLRYSRTTSNIYDNPFGNFTYIAFVAPPSSDEVISTIASLTLIEYIVQLCSCLGIWFGLSVVHLNPFKFIQCGQTPVPPISRKDSNYTRRKTPPATFILVRPGNSFFHRVN